MTPHARPEPNRSTTHILGRTHALSFILLLAPLPAVDCCAPLAVANAQPAAVADAAIPRAERLAAAKSILRSSDREQLANLATLIRAGAKPQPSDPELASILLEAVATTASPPPDLLPSLLDYAAECTPERLPQALLAIAALGTLDAARALVERLGPAHPPQTQEAAGLALSRLAGHADWGADAAKWGAWLASMSKLDPASYQREIAQSLLDQRAVQQLELARLRNLAGDGYRRLYLASAAPLRAALLAELLAAPEPALRDTALDIVTRELSDGARPDASVSPAIARLIEAPESAVRARAAALLALMPSPLDTPRLEAALQREREPRVAAELLRALERSPSPTVRDAAVAWMTRAPGPAGAAIAACADAGLLDTPEHKAAALEALAKQPCATLSAPALRLLAELGNDQDRARIAALLDTPPGSARVAAASALAHRPEFLSRILGVARDDPSLFLPSIDAALTAPITITTYRALEALPARSPGDRAAGLERAAAALAVPDLLNIASDRDRSPESRQSLLAPLTQHGPQRGPARPLAEAQSIASALLLLAETRLALRAPDLALVALDAVPVLATSAESDRATRLRLLALLRSNQLPAAVALEATPSEWLRALEACAADQNAAAIARLVRSRFARALTSEELKRLDEIATALGPAALEPDPAEAAAPPDSPSTDPMPTNDPPR